MGPRSQRGTPENGKSLKISPIAHGYVWVIIPKNPKVEPNKYHGAHTYVNGVHPSLVPRLFADDLPLFPLSNSSEFPWASTTIKIMVDPIWMIKNP